jgi:hypothetical protein
MFICLAQEHASYCERLHARRYEHIDSCLCDNAEMLHAEPIDLTSGQRGRTIPPAAKRMVSPWL